MNLVEELLKADSKIADDVEKKVIKSKRLGKILGLDKEVDIEIKEILPRKMKSIQSKMFTSKGNFDMEKAVDAQALCVVEGVINPDMKSKELREKFGCATPVDLALKLFRSEIEYISNEISALSGINADEEDIKN